MEYPSRGRWDPLWLSSVQPAIVRQLEVREHFSHRMCLEDIHLRSGPMDQIRTAPSIQVVDPKRARLHCARPHHEVMATDRKITPLLLLEQHEVQKPLIATSKKIGPDHSSRLFEGHEWLKIRSR